MQTLNVVTLVTIYWLPDWFRHCPWFSTVFMGFLEQNFEAGIIIIPILRGLILYDLMCPRCSSLKVVESRMKPMSFWSQKAGFSPSMAPCFHASQMRYVKLRKVKHFTEDHKLTCQTAMKTPRVWRGSPSYFCYCFSNNINVLGIFGTTFLYWITRIIGVSVLLNTLTSLISKNPILLMNSTLVDMKVDYASKVKQVAFQSFLEFGPLMLKWGVGSLDFQPSL